MDHNNIKEFLVKYKKYLNIVVIILLFFLMIYANNYREEFTNNVKDIKNDPCSFCENLGNTCINYNEDIDTFLYTNPDGTRYFKNTKFNRQIDCSPCFSEYKEKNK